MGSNQLIPVSGASRAGARGPSTAGSFKYGHKPSWTMVMLVDRLLIGLRRSMTSSTLSVQHKKWRVSCSTITGGVWDQGR